MDERSMIYKSIIGSRSYNLNSSDSDLDIGVVTVEPFEEKFVHCEDGCDFFLWTPEAFTTLWKVWSPRNYGTYTMLFPHEFCIDNDLSRWIVENREYMMKAILPELYRVYSSLSDRFISHSRNCNKLVMYAIHFRHLLANYAEGMSFKEAMIPTGLHRRFLLSVRNSTAPFELVQEECRKARKRMESVAGFYEKPQVDMSIWDEFKHVVYRETDLLHS